MESTAAVKRSIDDIAIAGYVLITTFKNGLIF